MATNVGIQVGKKNYVIDTDVLPPVGTKIPVHKHLTVEGSSAVLEVVEHNWRLEEGVPSENEEEANPELHVRIKTRMLP